MVVVPVIGIIRIVSIIFFFVQLLFHIFFITLNVKTLIWNRVLHLLSSFSSLKESHSVSKKKKFYWVIRFKEFTHLHKIITETEWPRITNYKSIGKKTEDFTLANEIRSSSWRNFQASDLYSWIKILLSHQQLQFKIWVWFPQNQNATQKMTTQNLKVIQF